MRFSFEISLAMRYCFLQIGPLEIYWSPDDGLVASRTC